MFLNFQPYFCGHRVHYLFRIGGHLCCLAGNRPRRSDGASEDRQGDKVQVPAIRADRRGFTVAELLIVVAIIAVLVGVAIPVFNNQAERAREATDLANVRSAYAEVMNTAISSTAALLRPPSSLAISRMTRKSPPELI